MKVLVVAHGHPSIHKGGGEVAAYSVFQMLRENKHQAVFLGWSGHAESPSKGSLESVGDDDYMLYTRSEFFHFSSTSPNLKNALETLFAKYDFDVVHFHHYIHVGIEAAAIIKQIKPSTRVILTLHEYLAICANNGQLLNKQGEICSGYSPANCTKCFPQHSENAFFMRELSIKAAFSFIDHFISPSEFLRQQYIQWGIPANKIDAIENPLPLKTNKPVNKLPPPRNGERWKIGFFGQINFYKGLDILLDGIDIAVQRGAEVEIGIHGKMSPVHDYPTYLDEVNSKIEKLGDRANFYGPYVQTDVMQIMQRYHFVVMGSRWYENSPVVIQEAIAAGRPLIVPAHGGMIEKVKDLGHLFESSNPLAIAKCLLALSGQSYLSLIGAVKEAANKVEVEVLENYKRSTNLYERS